MDFKGFKFGLILTGVLVLFTIPTFLNLLQTAESHYLPVIKDINVTSYHLSDEGNPVLAGDLLRSRDCTFKAITFFRNQSGYESPIGIQTPGRNITDRPPGVYSFGPWTLFTTEQILRDQSYARLAHSCHPLYDSITVIPMSKVLPNG